MRRRGPQDDAVDLLLDTICNMFGLVIFVAVLAAVIAGAKAQEQVDVVRSVHEVDSPVRDLDDLRATIAMHEQRVDQELVREHGMLESRLANARIELGRRERIRSSAETEAPGEVDLNGLFASVERLEQDLVRARGLRDITMRTPRRHELAGRLPVQIVLAGDRFMLVNDWSDWHAMSDPLGERCAFWTSWNPDVVDLRSGPGPRVVIHEGCEFRTGGQDIERWIPLRPLGGIALDESAGTHTALRALLRQLDANRHVISFKVAPDSFDTFGIARSTVVEAGFPYDVSPQVLGPDHLYHDRIRIGTATGQ